MVQDLGSSMIIDRVKTCESSIREVFYEMKNEVMTKLRIRVMTKAM